MPIYGRNRGPSRFFASQNEKKTATQRIALIQLQLLLKKLHARIYISVSARWLVKIVLDPITFVKKQLIPCSRFFLPMLLSKVRLLRKVAMI